MTSPLQEFAQHAQAAQAAIQAQRDSAARIAAEVVQPASRPRRTPRRPLRHQHRARPVAADTQMDDTRSELRLDQLARDMGEVKTSLAVIVERTADIKDHESRLRSLEATRSRLWAIWGGAVVLGAAIGWYLAWLTRVHGR